MSDNNKNINIKKILNLPIENDKSTEINYAFSIDLTNNFHQVLIDDNILLESENDFADQIKRNKIQINKEYRCATLWVFDDMNEKHTIYNFSYWLIELADKWYIRLCFKGFLKGEHLNGELEKQKFDRIETEVRYDKKISINYTCDSIKSTIEPIMSTWLPLWDNDSSEEMFDRKLKITLGEKKTFNEFEKILWRLSEFAFLCCEDMLFYDTLSVFIGDKEYILKHYLRTNDAKSRKRSLRTNEFNSNAFCINAFNENNFTSFMDFRTKSGFIFDVYRTTVHSDTFREDYPLRLSQTLEGLANYLNIADTSKGDTFRTAIHLSLYCNDFIKFYLPTFNEAKDFCDKITKHRNKFSHVKANGTYLQDDENEKFAEILYTTIRVLIIKHIKGEI